MAVCKNHSENAAIEHCEVCGDALCGLCLWYGDDGRRLCERHAREIERGGGAVQSPALYEEQIRVQEPGMVAERGIYRGNDTDLVAAAAALLGLASIATWFGGGLCLPLAAGVLGLAALTSRRKGLNPARAQWMGVFGTGMGLLGLLPLVFIICIFAFSLGLAVAGAAGGP